MFETKELLQALEPLMSGGFESVVLDGVDRLSNEIITYATVIFGLDFIQTVVMMIILAILISRGK